jgi:16S rRNA (guanine966-N2)-methyltransferase
MRIIGGEHRGRKIKQPPIDTVRPTKDRVRESVFNMIAARVPESNVLDIFSGSGSYGLEALSRGASGCTFVEKDPLCSNILKENIALIKAEEASSVMTLDAERALKSLGESGSKFNLIFADPPYNYNINKKLLIMIYQYDILDPTGALVIEHSTREKLPNEEGDVSIYKQKTYGNTSISVFMKK